MERTQNWKMDEAEQRAMDEARRQMDQAAVMRRMGMKMAAAECEARAASMVRVADAMRANRMAA
jgi:hypothetical protein